MPSFLEELLLQIDIRQFFRHPIESKSSQKIPVLYYRKISRLTSLRMLFPRFAGTSDSAPGSVRAALKQARKGLQKRLAEKM